MWTADFNINKVLCDDLIKEYRSIYELMQKIIKLRKKKWSHLCILHIASDIVVKDWILSKMRGYMVTVE